jgi:hypothetical protein
MNHFADLSSDLNFVNIRVLIHKFNKKSSGRDFSADRIADFHKKLVFKICWRYVAQNKSLR